MPDDVVYLPGDGPPAGREVSRVTRVLTPLEVRANAAEARLRAGRATLRATQQQAQTFADGAGALTLAQLTNTARQLAGGIALLAQTLMDIELMLAYQQDDGVE